MNPTARAVTLSVPFDSVRYIARFVSEPLEINPADIQPVNHHDYDPQFFDAIASIEDRHFWFTSRNRTICAALQPILQKFHRRYRVLEVGCGTGAVLTELV